MNFGEKLAKLRKEKGMSQEDLANNLSVSRQAVSKWESNNSYPETDKIVAICKLFNCSMDELIGLKEGKVKTKNKLFEKFNDYFEMVLKAIKLFYSMTFKQKIKCGFEICFYVLAFLIFFIIFNQIFIEIVLKLFNVLPYELLSILTQTLQGILYLVYLVISIYALAKLYKIRYLDYYENYEEKKEIVEEEKIEKKIDNKINIKEEKIIIRDPNNDFKPFSWFKQCLLLFVKFISGFFTLGLLIAFVILIACTIFILYFINNGIILLYITIGLVGAILGIYVLIEILIKFIFNMEQKPKKLFIMFIVSCLIVGISGGLFSSEVSTYKIVDTFEYNEKTYEDTIKMEDNLVVNLLHYESTEIIFENRNDILVEYYTPDIDVFDIKVNIDNWENTVYCDDYSRTYIIYDYWTGINYNNQSLNDVLTKILNLIQRKEIIIDNNVYGTKNKVYISKANYEKLIKNQKDQEFTEYC